MRVHSPPGGVPWQEAGGGDIGVGEAAARLGGRTDRGKAAGRIKATAFRGVAQRIRAAPWPLSINALFSSQEETVG
jgi:hypothetical protein